MFLRKNIIIALLSVTLLSTPLWERHAQADDNHDFQEILKDHWARAVQEKVFFRTDPDGFRMTGKLPEFNKRARDRRAAFNDNILKRLSHIQAENLTQKDRVSYKIFVYERQTEASSAQQPNHLFPLTKLFGYHTYFADAPANMSFLKARDYENYLISLADFPRYNREHLGLLAEAVSKGYTQYCKSMEGYESSIRQHIVKDPRDSLLFGPFKNFPRQMPAAQQAAFAEKGLKLVTKDIIPQYQALYDFYTQVYQPNCRKEVGVSSLKNGAEFYKSRIEYFTTTDMKPQEIHQLGLDEIHRIRAEMTAIIKNLGFTGSFAEFLDSLRTTPKFYAKSEHELLATAALIAKTMEGELPKYFGLLPRNTYSIKAATRGAFYMPSSGDGTTSGTYFLGTKNLAVQPLYTLEALTYHEGMPGHHLQTALAKELDIPPFRRSLSHSAFAEGWGLYSERLGKDMGFYQDPYSDFGRLTYETWRACRLVVDTGLHAFGWSRQKAITFMMDNTGLTLDEVESEIDRYITWPAQALSYKIGEIKIRRLRKKAEETLGEKFDLRDFHDTVLGQGSLPIAILDELVNEWINRQK